MTGEANHKRWQPGEAVVRQEVLNDGRVWLRFPVLVVRDDPGVLATYVPEGTPFEFPEGNWPTSNGRHPWHGRRRWKGRVREGRFIAADLDAGRRWWSDDWASWTPDHAW